jgi:hypothetical protein
VTMASKRSKALTENWEGRRVTFLDFAVQIAERRAELGEIEVPRNSGKNRTASKRALLKAIEDAGGKW